MNESNKIEEIFWKRIEREYDKGIEAQREDSRVTLKNWECVLKLVLIVGIHSLIMGKRKIKGQIYFLGKIKIN